MALAQRQLQSRLWLVLGQRQLGLRLRLRPEEQLVGLRPRLELPRQWLVLLLAIVLEQMVLTEQGGLLSLSPGGRL